MAGTDRRVVEAHAYRDGGKWWTIEIPELMSDGPEGRGMHAVGGAVSVKDLQEAATDLAAVWLDADQNTLDVRVTLDTPEAVRRLWNEGATAEAEARDAVQRAALLRRRAVQTLRAEGYTLDVSARLLGISRQRVQQLAQSAETTSESVASS
ncbi:MAG TPA: XRE family transcriptional regulator [Lacisediminihabitans sp.]|uniref:XRE family transcriptional regulator n=1 Tax=Lacisediminihabitans sp. TaxID=2787631 RepID=UPI002EDA1F44